MIDSMIAGHEVGFERVAATEPWREPLRRAADGSVHGWRCRECGGAWRVYQSECHVRGCSRHREAPASRPARYRYAEGDVLRRFGFPGLRYLVRGIGPEGHYILDCYEIGARWLHPDPKDCWWACPTFVQRHFRLVES